MCLLTVERKTEHHKFNLADHDFNMILNISDMTKLQLMLFFTLILIQFERCNHLQLHVSLYIK